MNLKLILASLLFAITFNLNAQSDKLVGKWKYKDVHEKEKIDAQGLQMLEMFFGEMTLYFDSKGNHKVFMMGKIEEGKYNLSDDGKTIQLLSNKGAGEEIELVEISDKELIIKMGSGDGAMILERVAVEEADKQVETPKKIQKQTATKQQIAGKWLLDAKKTAEKLTSTQREMFGELMDGSYFEFCENGKYKANILGAKAKGKWELGADNSTVIVHVDNSTKVWSILNVDDDNLGLLQGDAGKKYYFTR